MSYKRAAIAAAILALAIASPVCAEGEDPLSGPRPGESHAEAHARLLMSACRGASKGDLDWMPGEYLSPALFTSPEIAVLTEVCRDIVKATDPYPEYWK